MTPFCRLHGGGRRCQHKGCDNSAIDGEFCVAHGAVRLQCARAGFIKPSKFGGMCSLHADGDWKANQHVANLKNARIAWAKKRMEALLAQAALDMAKFGMQLEG